MGVNWLEYVIDTSSWYTSKAVFSGFKLIIHDDSNKKNGKKQKFALIFIKLILADISRSELQGKLQF